MRTLLRLLLPLLGFVLTGVMLFGFWQASAQEERLYDDLRRRAQQVAEGMEPAAHNALVNRNRKLAQRLVQSFERRERVQGGVIYGRDGAIIAITPRLTGWAMTDTTTLEDVGVGSRARERQVSFNGHAMHAYLLPVYDSELRLLGAVEVAYTTDYIRQAMAETWERLLVLLTVLVSGIAITTLLLWRRLISRPLAHLTDWFRRFQRGERLPVTPHGYGDQEIGSLATEVEQVALNLRIARKSVVHEARERLREEESWTEDKLRDLTRARLRGNPLLVVSNREPYMHVIDEEGGQPHCLRPASGVVTAIDPILRACGGTWIAHGSGNADRQFVNSHDKLGVPPEDDRYILKRVWLSKEEEEGYYYGFANEGLWPLCHITHTRPVFRESDWAAYVAANRRFADSVLAELPAKNAFIFIQDYHFTLLPRMLREARPDAVIAMFWHIPWPNPEMFAICPYQAEILDGMLGCDLLGFHVQYHCNNFLETVNRTLESRIDMERFTVVQGGRETRVRAFPISVDPAPAVDDAAERAAMARMRREYRLEGKTVAVGVDRIDYTKGLPERIQAVDRFLEEHPEWRGRFVLVQIAAPSRTHIKRYHDFMGELDDLVEKTNWKYAEGNWRPIIYLKRHFPMEAIRPFYRLADLCLVSSLHDGMNLVAKEFISAQAEEQGTLLLSCFTGAARELTDALIFNPYSTGEFARAIHTAVVMPADERKRRMRALRAQVQSHTIYRWAGDIISEMGALGEGR